MTSSSYRSGVDVIAILIPIFNDWGSLALLLSEIDTSLGSANLKGLVIVVDDCSTVTFPDEFRFQNYLHLSSFEVIRLHCNLGHQRAIAVGLAYLHNSGVGANAVVVMDGDGQDRPQDIPRLIDVLTTEQSSVVFASRLKRSEEFAFRLMYLAYRFLHRLLTGVSVRWGNFSVISSSALPGLLICPDVWNHYAGAVARSRIPFSTVPLPRGTRYIGESHMRYGNLVAHGLSAIAVFNDSVAVRLIILFSALLPVLSVLFGLELYARIFTSPAFQWWATILTGMLILLSAQGLLWSMLFALTILGSRSNAKIVPLLESARFIESVARLFSANDRN